MCRVRSWWVFDWDRQDPAGLPLDEVRAIRDDIARRISELVLELDQ
jgi:hypothetical protein